MKKLILNEDKFNVLLEYAGFVSGWQKLIEHIYETSERNLYKLIRSVVPLQYLSRPKKEIWEYFENLDNISLDEPMKDFIIVEKHLNMLNVYGIKQITIEYTIDDNLGGAFNKDSMTVGEDGKLNNFTIILNLRELYLNGEKFKETIQHELTHAYEMLKRYSKKGEVVTNRNFGNKHYTTDAKGIVNGISYYFSKIEMNAVVSEAAYRLQRMKARNEQDCWDILQNSTCNNFLNTMREIRNGLENNINYTYSIIEFLHMNPEHIDMFPSTKGYSIQSYQKRLIKVADYKINYLMKKLNKVVKTYLKRKGVVN